MKINRLLIKTISHAIYEFDFSFRIQIIFVYFSFRFYSIFFIDYLVQKT